MIRRRDFITLLGCSATAWPLAARAQQTAMPVIGFLNHGSPERMGSFLAAFRTGLSEGGFVEGRNVAIEFRWAQFDNDRLSELAADLVRRRVSVIATPVSTPAALAAKAATGTIPIVFGIGTDPVQTGLVASLNRPGGNVTGVSAVNVELTAKRLGLLHELIPRADGFAALVSPNDPNAEAFTSDAQSAAAAIGRGSKSSAPAAIKISTSPLRASCGASYPHSLSVPMQCSWRAAFNSSVYRCDTRCPRSIPGAKLSDRRIDELRIKFYRDFPPSRHLHQPHSQRGGPSRLPCLAGLQVRVCHQSANGKDAGHRDAANAARQRRRGDRVAAQPITAYGTSETNSDDAQRSAYRGQSGHRANVGESGLS